MCVCVAPATRVVWPLEQLRIPPMHFAAGAKLRVPLSSLLPAAFEASELRPVTLSANEGIRDLRILVSLFLSLSLALSLPRSLCVCDFLSVVGLDILLTLF